MAKEAYAFYRINNYDYNTYLKQIYEAAKMYFKQIAENRVLKGKEETSSIFTTDPQDFPTNEA